MAGNRGADEPWALRNALAIVLAGVVVALATFTLAYWSVGGSDKDRFDIGIKAATAFAAAFVGVLTWGRLELSRREHRLAVDRDLTERYGRAVEQLGSEESLIRAGGAFALERFALDAFALAGSDNQIDWRMALDLLAAFVRQARPASRSSQDDPAPVPPDVMAALRVLGRFQERTRTTKPVRYDLHEIDLAHADLTGQMLIGADLTGADLTAARLNGADLSDADLTGADLTDATVARYTYIPVRGPRAEGTLESDDVVPVLLIHRRRVSTNTGFASAEQAALIRADLTGANLATAEFTGANLTDADLSHAYLGETNLTGANLPGAELTRGDLTGAILPGAKLTRADLTGADLTDAKLGRDFIDHAGTDLTGANLTDAKLTGVDLTDVFYDNSTVWPEGFTPPASGPNPCRS
jgi:uncharacterized protein YjbI with pentapeptide repeats